MTTYSSSRGASLERAYQHWRERGALLELPHSEPADTPLTIAISRELGAGGSAIAHAVAERMGWPLYDKELVDQISEDTGVHTQLLEQLDERRPNWFAECLSGLSDHKNMSGVGFAIRLRKVLVALYCHGHCVILGRGAAQVLPTERTLRIRLVAPREARVERMSKILGSVEDADRMVNDSDRDRAAFVKSYFMRDPNTTLGYDLTIDTSRFSRGGCTNVILSAIEDRGAKVQGA